MDSAKIKNYILIVLLLLNACLAALVLMAGVGESGVLPGLGEDGAGALGLMILLGCVVWAHRAILKEDTKK